MALHVVCGAAQVEGTMSNRLAGSGIAVRAVSRQRRANLADSVNWRSVEVTDASLSVVTVAIPYFSPPARSSPSWSRGRKVVGWALACDLAITTSSVLFSFWVTIAAGYQAVYQALPLLLVGIPLDAFLKARRERNGDVLEPADVVSSA
jgi:hypothetical protein